MKSQKCCSRSIASDQWNVIASSTPHGRVRRTSSSTGTDSSTVAAPIAVARPSSGSPCTDRACRPHDPTSWSWYSTAQLVAGSMKPEFSLAKAAKQ